MSVFYITFAALFLCSIYLSAKYKENIEDTLATAACGLILLLYLLAFFREMRLIGIIALVYFAFTLYRLIALGYAEKIRGEFFVFFGASAMVTLVGIMTSKMQVTWWDDINFWFSDAKQMYFLNGFPGKYGNVSPEFGDYPPVTSIFKWLFLQIDPVNYRESLQFTGYFALNLLLLLPLFGKIKKSGLGLFGTVLGFFAVLMAPGIFNGIIYYGTPADITMGIIYGALLLTAFEREGHNEFFYYVRIALYTAVLLLTKSVGIEWAVFALAFYFVFAKRSLKIVPTALFSLAFYVSWLVFCLLNRRVAKLTGAGLKMAASGNYRVPQNTKDKAAYFISGFFTMPMHADRNITLDISAGCAVILLFIFLYVLWKKGIAAKNDIKKLAVFMAVTGALTYGIVFLAHISIFQTEEQYLDAFAMAVSLARYAFPYLFGAFYLLTGILFEKADMQRTDKTQKICVAGFFALVFLTADYSGIYRHLWGYRQTLEEDVRYNYDMVTDEGRRLVDTAASDSSLWGKRVLVMRDGHTYHWVHDTYISKEASPVPLVYDGFLAEQDDSLSVSRKIISSHASYIYVEDDEMLSGDIFTPLMSGGGEVFASGKVYRVIAENDTVRLCLP